MLKKHGFILALIGSIILAYLNPQFGAREGPIRAEVISKLGVMVIFLLQGLSLRTRELAGGMRQFKLHGFIQLWIFILSAIVLVLSALILKALSLHHLADGFLYLALIPTTISSAVAFTSAAKGNVPVAIFNTTLSNIIGVFWVPTGCLLLFAAGGTFQSELIAPMLWKVAQLILLPMIIGQLARPFVYQRNWFKNIAPHFKLVNHSIIIFIVYSAFCQSIASNAWDGIGAGSIVILLMLTLMVVLIIHGGAWISGRLITTKLEDRITILFCGAQKTLAAGAPMAVAIFSQTEQLSQVNLGLLLLPLLCYHPIQLFLAAMLLPGFTRAR
jgi:sodium/bile acid cotransporter 7